MKLCLAGTEDGEDLGTAMLAGGSSYLASYWHLLYAKGITNRRYLEWMKLYSLMRDHSFWIMDSGLFTMMFGAGKGNTYTYSDLRAYTDQYIKTMHEIGYVHTIVEMDIHKVLGPSYLEEFRKPFEDNWGVDRTIFVWHIEEGRENWGKLVDRYPYVAISVPELRILSKNRIQVKKMILNLIYEAQQIKPSIKIHLLGNTQPDLLEIPGYYTADSTSWLSGGRWGNTYMLHHNKLLKLHTRSQLYKEFETKHFATFMKRFDNLVRISGIAGMGTKKMENYLFSMYCGAKAFVDYNVWINSRFFPGDPVVSLADILGI